MNNNLNSIRFRLLTAFLLIALIPLLSVAVITYQLFEAALRDQVTTKIQTVANANGTFPRLPARRGWRRS
jgi:nitrogen fixation/metabolism regulation signal transduction histidine kinase